MKRKIKHRLAEALGFYLMKKRKTGPYPATEYHVVRAAKEFNIDCIFDVGAHFGETGLSLRDLGYKGWIISFEPGPTSLEHLKKASKNDPKWRVFSYALGDENKEQDFFITEDPTLASFFKSSQYGQERFGNNIQTKSVPVQVRRLDSIFEEVTSGIDCKKYFLKMDTQGNDIHVFRGASGCLDQIYGLQSELVVKSIYEGTSGYLDGLQIYSKAGFVPGGFYPVGWQEDHQTLLEFDAVMFRP